MKANALATWILVGLLAVAFLLDLSGLTARMPDGGSFFLGSTFALGFLIGGATLLRFGLMRRPFRRLWAWVSIVLLYFSFFVLRAVIFQDEEYRPSLLFVLCVIAAFRILRMENTSPRPAAPSLEAPTEELSSSPSEVEIAADSEVIAGPPQAGERSASAALEAGSIQEPKLRHGRVWPLVALALLVVAAILFEIRSPSASFKLSNFGILLGGWVVGGSIRFLYSGCRHFEGSRFGPGIAALVWAVAGIGAIFLIQSVPGTGLDIGEILSFHTGDATLGFVVAGLTGFSMASWLRVPDLGKTTNRLLLIGASVGLGVLLLGLWLDQISQVTQVKTSEPASSTEVRWRIETFDGREYVSDRNVAEFYSFETLESHDGTRVFRHPKVLMAWVVGRPAILINGVEIELQHPILERQGTAYLTTVDLAKIVEPIIRPGHIRTTTTFDSVVISLGGQPGSLNSESNPFLDELTTRLTADLVAGGIAVEFTDIFPATSEDGRSMRVDAEDKQAVYLDLRLLEADSGATASLSTYALVPPDNVIVSQKAGARQPVRDLESISLAVAIHSHVMGLVSDGEKRLARLEEKSVVEIDAPTVRVVIKSSKLSGDTTEEQRRELAHGLSKAVAEGILRWKSAM